MKISTLRIHNFRSIIDAEIEVHDFLLLVGANNAGKSNVINAVRCFYEDCKWSEDDLPKKGMSDSDSWVELRFKLTDNEWMAIDDRYVDRESECVLILKRHFKGAKVKAKQSNIYAVVDGVEDDAPFYNAKSIGTARCGSIIYVPALTTPGDQMKTTGPSPLRSMLNFMLKKVVAKSSAYSQLGAAFEALNTEAKQDNGFLTQIAHPINMALEQWNVKIDLSVNAISHEEISKSLVKFAFVDGGLAESAFDLDRFGHGFQRSVIYELIRIAPSFQDVEQPTKNQFNPEFTLVLFEEPEAFLHPSQQEAMSYHLRKLGRQAEQQVIVTSHSPVFVSKSSAELCQICRIQKVDGVSKVYQLKAEQKDELTKAGAGFLVALQAYVDDPTIEDGRKSKARKLIASAPNGEIATQHERFRFQLWLDSDRASMFFADKVMLVEGATEKALFNYLLANDWHELSRERILVVDALGKFNFHRFLSLFRIYGIYHGIMFDNDSEKDEHGAINQFIRDRKNEYTLADPFEFKKCLEYHLELTLPGRDDQKPLFILKALEEEKLTVDQLSDLRASFCQSLAIPDN